MIDTFSETKTVLVVDDQIDKSMCPWALLKERGFRCEVVQAGSGSDALDYLYGRGQWRGRDTRKQPELVVIGLRMRRATDLEFLRRLRTDPVLHYLVVVFLATSKAEAERALDGALRPDLCMVKPATPAELKPLAERLHSLLS